MTRDVTSCRRRKKHPGSAVTRRRDKASPAKTGDGPEGSLRHEESNSYGSGERDVGVRTCAVAQPAERLSGSADATFRRRGAKSPRSCTSERGNG